jgi:hypothetical protein
MAINAHGGLLCMQTPVQAGQRLFLINRGNERTQECVVVFVEKRLARGVAVAFQFPTPMSQFWHNLEIGNRRSSAPNTPLEKLSRSMLVLANQRPKTIICPAKRHPDPAFHLDGGR